MYHLIELIHSSPQLYKLDLIPNIQVRKLKLCWFR